MRLKTLQVKFVGRLQQYKFFWTFKNWYKNAIHFNFWKIFFQGQYWVREERTGMRFFESTLTSFFKAIFYSAVIIIILQQYNHFYPVSITFDSEAADTFLGAIASLSGVFLGLYFTAISSIASNLLLKAHQDVKEYFFSSPMGSQYVQTVEITGIVSLFYLVTKSFGYTLHPVGFIFLSLLGAYIVIRFWKVGAEVYNFAQPTSSLPLMMREITMSIKDVAPPGFNWNKDFLQNHRAKRVNRILDSVKRYIEFGVNEIKLKEEELSYALHTYATLLDFYTDYKRRIPTNSFWYRTKYQYNKWTLTDSSQILVALHTGTTTSPQEIKNYTWFEGKVLDSVVPILSFYLRDRNYGAFFQSHEIFVSTAEIYAPQFDVEAVKNLVNRLEILGDEFYRIPEDLVTSQTAKSEKMAFIDSQGRLAIAVMLGLTKYLHDTKGSDFPELVEKINWKLGKKAVYKEKVPYETLARLESLADELFNEQSIEGRILTERWYRQSYCLQRYLYALQSYYDYIKSLHNDYFEKKFTVLVELKRFDFTAQLLERWMEFSSKHVDLLRHLKRHLEEVEQYKSLHDLPWPDFKLDEELAWAEKQEKVVSDKLIALLPILQGSVSDAGIPDYFGHALTLGVKACYEACEEGDVERFRRIFPIVHNASIVAHQRTRTDVEAWKQEESKIIYSTEPLVNLFEISGFGILYSELLQNLALKEVVEETWDRYFTSVQDAKAVIQFIAAIVEYRKGIFKIMPQATLRANWQIAFNHAMSEKGLPVFPDIRGPYSDDPNHPSILIKVISDVGGLNMRSAEDVFIEMYLSNRPEAEGVDFADDIRESIRRYEERANAEIEYE